MLLHKKIVLLSLILVSCEPILGMFNRAAKKVYFPRKALRPTCHLLNHTINRRPDITRLSDEKIEQFLRDNGLTPNNLALIISHISKMTPSQIEAANEFKQRQQNKEWHKEKEEKIE